MKKKLNIAGVKRLLAVQLMLPLLIAGFLFAIYGKDQALSALLGGFVGFAPSLLFAINLFKKQGARAARQIVRSFYIGEFLKIISSMVLFTLVFMLYKVSPLAFFLTYITVVMTYWLAPLLIDKK